jgi:hypothetical protein
MKKSGSPKKKPKATHVALYLPREVLALYARCMAIWTAMKADQVHFPSPYPSPNEIDADLAALFDALQEVEGGGQAAKTALLVAERKVRQTFELLGKYAQSVVRAGPAEDAPATIGGVLMYESNLGNRPAKAELEVRQGVTSGVVSLIALAVASATGYFWESSVDQVTWTAGSPTSQASGSIAGLTPGKVYYFRFRALTRDEGLTEYSQVVSFMPR